MIVTCAPSPTAILAALCPTTPPPIIATFAADNTRDSAQQNPASAIRCFKVLRADLHSHAARDFTHGSQQRKRTILFADRLIGDRIDSLLQQLYRSVPAGEPDADR